MKNIIVFASGSGTNFEAIVKATQSGIINGFIGLLVCNKPEANCIKIAEENGIPVLVKPYWKHNQTREEYYEDILENIKQKIDLVVLAGWMLIVTPNFITTIKIMDVDLINLHPALPGQFPGINAIERAYESYQHNEITESGLMIHHVVPEIDAGTVICQEVVPIFRMDTIESFKARMQYFEKPTLIKAINMVLKKNEENVIDVENVYTGKVSNVYEIKHNGYKQPFLAIYHTDRLSAFNRNLCDIPDKGRISTLLTNHWAQLLKKQVKNAFIKIHQNTIGYHECRPIKLEIIVRGYISGSLWRQYEKGERTIYGINFPDGLVKYQRLDNPIITPTVKSESDDPITVNELLEQNIVTKEEWDKISEMALKIYTIGYIHCDEKGIILADTKYEFGYGPDNDIWLMDEIHTFDTSRFWLKETYQSNMEKGLKPESLDKDFVRDWILENESCELPDDIKDKMRQIYIRVASMIMPGFTEDYLKDEKLMNEMNETNEIEEVSRCILKFLTFNAKR